jgi:hypothetical protein
LKWSLAKRKMLVQKYGTPSGLASHVVLLGDVHQSDVESDALGAGPSKMECGDEYDDKGASVSFNFVAFFASAPPGRGP